MGKSGRDGIQPGAYGGRRWSVCVRIVFTEHRGAAEFAYCADRAAVHLVGLGFRAGCRGSELWAGWPDGVRCTLGRPQWPVDHLLLAALWLGAIVWRHYTSGHYHPRSAGGLLRLQGHETKFG